MDEGLLKRLREGAEDVTDGWACALICDAADALEEIHREYESISKSLDEAVELIRKKDSKYNVLLKAAHSMHTWIFLNSFDEQKAYDECGLTPEMNTLLGYGGRYVAEVPKEEEDADS